MPIDATQVTWDDPASTTSTSGQEVKQRQEKVNSVDTRSPGAIDAAQVTWDLPESPPQEPKQRSTLHEIGRQVGLTARHGLEGVAQAAEIVTEPIRQAVVAPAARALGMPEGRPLSAVASDAADAVGLPKPENATERVVGDAARFAAGGAGIAGAARGVARAVAPAAEQALGTGTAQVARGPLQTAAESMAANPGMQIAGSAGTGIGAGIAREDGGGTGAQIAAGLAGGLGVSGLMQAARGAINSASVLMPVRANRLEQQISQTLERSGVNWDQVPEGIRAGLRGEVEKAMRTGQPLNADALARLVDFKRVGATPTRGTVSLDPVQITREQNLARMGANASDEGLHGLARVQNENNRALVDNLNRLGADHADDAFAAGERAIGGLQRGLDAQKANVDHLYSQARDSAGRSFPLDGHAFTSAASKLLDDNLLGGALPPSVQDHLNRIAQGQVPFTVDYAQQLATAIGKLQRGTSDGQARMALGMVRRALDDTPILELGQQGPAAGVRMTGTIAPHAGGTDLGEQAMQAFSKARTANREMMKRIERVPGLKAVYEGKAAPDDFIQKQVIGRSAKATDVQALATELKAIDPQAFEAVRASIAQHLKTAAIGTASDEAAKFSASGFNRARLALGAHKLQAFFSPEEVEQLGAVGKVAHYTTALPAGSAVNNSNSGAFLMGRGLDLLDRLSAKVPLFGIGPTVSGISKSVQQEQAMSLSKALVKQPAAGLARPPTATFGALMSTTSNE